MYFIQVLLSQAYFGVTCYCRPDPDVFPASLSLCKALGGCHFFLQHCLSPFLQTVYSNHGDVLGSPTRSLVCAVLVVQKAFLLPTSALQAQHRWRSFLESSNTLYYILCVCAHVWVSSRAGGCAHVSLLTVCLSLTQQFVDLCLRQEVPGPQCTVVFSGPIRSDAMSALCHRLHGDYCEKWSSIPLSRLSQQFKFLRQY